eukprot:scaffold931_cov383-Prasinococcus_capsulatus_cf.AAC.23
MRLPPSPARSGRTEQRYNPYYLPDDSAILSQNLFAFVDGPANPAAVALNLILHILFAVPHLQSHSKES